MGRALNQKFGLGIELEGFLVDKTTKKPKEFIGDLPSSQWVIERANEKLEPFLGVEQASVMLEVRTDVCGSPDACVESVRGIRNSVNDLLDVHGAELRFFPVAPADFTFVPSTTDENSRAHALIRQWGYSEDGLNLLYSTVIAGLQVNDSRMFRNLETDEEKISLAMNIHNRFSQKFSEDILANDPVKSPRGMTRSQHLLHLLPGVKGAQFRRRGFEPECVVCPPKFEFAEQFQRYSCAHSDVDNFGDAEPKDQHTMTCKVRWVNGHGGYWSVESRCSDARDDLDEVLKEVQRMVNRMEGEYEVKEVGI